MSKKLVLIIGFIVALFLIIIIVKPIISFTAKQVKDELKLGNISNNRYSFYYPKEWIRENIEGSELAFFAVKTNGVKSGESIVLDITPNDNGKEHVPASESFCVDMAQGVVKENPSLRGKVTNAIVTNSHPKYEGCKFIVMFDDGKVPATFEVKSIWYKDRRDNMVYTVKTNYYSDTNQELVNTIKDSINTFSIN